MPDADRLAEILGDWYERRDRGEAVDPQDVIDAHPDLADALRARFAALHLVDLALDGALPSGPERPEAIGPYRVLAELGAGGMGRVFLAAAGERTPSYSSA